MPRVKVGGIRPCDKVGGIRSRDHIVVDRY